MPLYIGPQETDKLEKIAPGLELVGRLRLAAHPRRAALLAAEVAPRASSATGAGRSSSLTILIKLVFYPLNAKAGRSMAQMKVLAPKMEKLKQLYGDDKQKMNQAMMELYRTEKINPLGGCLPILVQIPVFIALYWVLLASIELRHAPWLGWIQDLSAPDPYFVLPVIYAISMFVQTKLNPQPADPVQAQVMLIMPIMFSVFFLFFPSGLVLYWVVQNLIGIVQQWHINRTLEARGEGESPALSAAADTIAAVATPAGRGGIGVVRVSGPRRAPSPRASLGTLPAPRHATLARFPRCRRRADRQRHRALLSRARIRTPARTCSSCRATAAPS